jgi:hypothetical protein
VPPEDPSGDPEFVWRGPVRPPGRDVLEELGGRRGGLPFDPASIAPVAFKVFSLFGCLRRLVVLVIVLVVLAMLAFFGLFGVGGLLYGAEPGAGAGRITAPGYCVQSTTVPQMVLAVRSSGGVAEAVL